MLLLTSNPTIPYPSPRLLIKRFSTLFSSRLWRVKWSGGAWGSSSFNHVSLLSVPIDRVANYVNTHSVFVRSDRVPLAFAFERPIRLLPKPRRLSGGDVTLPFARATPPNANRRRGVVSHHRFRAKSLPQLEIPCPGRLLRAPIRRSKLRRSRNRTIPRRHERQRPSGARK